MNHAQLLDCTLRDGAYLVDKKFGDTAIKGIIGGLVKAKIDYVEIGFLQDDGFGEGKTVFKNSRDAKRFVPQNKGGCQFALLADYSRYSIENLDECAEDSIDIIRECFFKEERYEALEVCRIIKRKGYKLFVQPVDILGYTDMELIEFIQLVNEIEPFCFSIVDTFGSMYQEDLHRVFELINHNLISTCKIGFHSHNNMQLSNALTQEFIRMTIGKREVVVDSTISGMGRGAGNTPTELVAQYMVSKLGYGYDMDVILDIIDEYMDNIRSRCTWGYSTPFFVAGCYSAHVNNIFYLSKKNSIRSKDMRYVLNKIGGSARKRYEYDLLEKTYVELLQSDIDDKISIEKLERLFSGKKVLVLVPGSSVSKYEQQIQKYKRDENPIVVSVNFLHDNISSDYMFVSNIKRYDYWKNDSRFELVKKIYTSNIVSEEDRDTEVVSFMKLVKCGWEYLDNSTIMLLRLLNTLKVQEVKIAGFDGYDYQREGEANYTSPLFELSSVKDSAIVINKEISEMLRDFNTIRKYKIVFLTPSRFEECLKDER